VLQSNLGNILHTFLGANSKFLSGDDKMTSGKFLSGDDKMTSGKFLSGSGKFLP